MKRLRERRPSTISAGARSGEPASYVEDDAFGDRDGPEFPELVQGQPVRGGAPAGQQAGRGQDERTRAHRRGPRARLVRVPEPPVHRPEAMSSSPNWSGSNFFGINHAGIITKMQNGMPIITQHTRNVLNDPLSFWLRRTHDDPDPHVWVIRPNAG
jgi:hypothetical protein